MYCQATLEIAISQQEEPSITFAASVSHSGPSIWVCLCGPLRIVKARQLEAAEKCHRQEPLNSGTVTSPEEREEAPGAEEGFRNACCCNARKTELKIPTFRLLLCRMLFHLI